MRVTKRAVAGVVCGLCCALCAGLYLMQANGQVEQARAEALARYGGDQVEVCVATRDLSAGEVVSSGDVALRLWVADLLPADAVTDSSQIVGRRLGSDIYQGEVVCARRTEVSTAELNVPQGMAALSVPARSVQTVGGSVEPGMSVDVYATGPSSTTRLVRGALVLATSASADDTSASSGSEWVTLAIQPSSVQELVAAAQNLQLYFVIPSDAEESVEDEEPSTPIEGAAPPASDALLESAGTALEEPEAVADEAEGGQAQ